MTFKDHLFAAAERSGLMDRVAASRWRRRRLMILCYHGISMADEHDWDPELYMSPETFRGRLRYLREHGYRILPLAEALEMLERDELPERSVALTFDDGAMNFIRSAIPALVEYDAPAMLYLTTYYVDRRLPVFDTSLSYLLWKGRFGNPSLAELIGSAEPLQIASLSQRRQTAARVREFAAVAGIGAVEKQALLERIAERTHVDLSDLDRDQRLYIMDAESVRALPPALVDVQLHTHRHRTPLDESAFGREITDNRRRIQELLPAGRALTHFCYPSGVYHGAFLPWLRSGGVSYATTCIPDIVTRESPPLLLPRFVDTEGHSLATFAAWVSGLAALLPRRRAYRIDQALLDASPP
jgi:peptidoglycan/xylan/chitin deacetylase (PgdA/CDA1 family)